MKLYVGLKYINTVGRHVTIEELPDNKNHVTISCPDWSKTYRNSVKNIQICLAKGLYKPINFIYELPYKIY